LLNILSISIDITQTFMDKKIGNQGILS